MTDKSRKKVLYVITKSVWGGAGKYVYDLATNLPKDRFEVFVAAGGKDELAQRLISAGISYFEIKNFQRDVSILKDILAYFEIFFLLFKLRPDIIHVNSSKAGGIVGTAAFDYRFLGFKFNLKTVFTAHGWAFNEKRNWWQVLLIKLFTKITCFYYSKIICVSEYDRLSAIKNLIAPARKLITVHNGIDCQKISFFERNEAQKILIGKISPLVIGTIAEWTKNKGLTFLLEAILKMKEIKFDVVLIGSGENPNQEKIYGFIEKYNLKNVYLHKWIPNAASYLKAFDVFVLPSLKEGLPYTLLEAGLAGLPVVATKAGGIPEIIRNEREGLLIEIADVNDLAEKIEEIINNPEKGKLLATNLWHKVIGEFSFEKMLNATITAYER